MYLISFNTCTNSGGLFIIITVLEVRKRKLGLMKQFVPGHIALSGEARIPGEVS